MSWDTSSKPRQLRNTHSLNETVLGGKKGRLGAGEGGGREAGIRGGLLEDHLYFITELPLSPSSLCMLSLPLSLSLSLSLTLTFSLSLSLSLSLSHTHTHCCSDATPILNSSEDAKGTSYQTPVTSSPDSTDAALKAENWTSLLEPSFPDSRCCRSHCFFTEAAPLSQGSRVFLNLPALPSPCVRIAGMG